MSNEQYKQYIVLLDPTDEDEKRIIAFIERKHTKKLKNSYAAILRAALELLRKSEEG
jgi:hypothetical protein